MLRALFVAMLTGTALCQGQSAPVLLPPYVDFGTLRTGAVAEASLEVQWQQADPATEATAEADGPLRRLRLRTRQADAVTPAFTTLAFRVDSSKEGEFSAAWSVQRGTERAKVPVRWRVERSQPGGSRILIASTPFYADSTDEPKDFAAWRQLVAEARLDIDYRFTREDSPAFPSSALARVDIVLVAGSTLVRLDEQQIARLQGFVCGGGRLIVCASAFFAKTVPQANRLCEPFGLQMLDREPPPRQRHAADKGELPRHALTTGVRRISVHRPTPTAVIDEARGRPLVQLPVFGPEHAFAAIARTQSGGEVITVGTPLWWRWVGEDGDNARLLRNLLVRPPRLR